MIEFTIQRRDMSSGDVIVRPVKIDTTRIGIVVIDMWNFHWCKTTTERAGALVPRMERCLVAARKLGMHVFYCPTDVVEAYVGTSMREKALATKIHLLPKLKKFILPSPLPEGDGCACGPEKCLVNFGWDGMHPGLSIYEGDLMPNSFEVLYSICKEKGIEFLIFMGIATQACLLGRSVGMLNMLSAGFNCILARDLTDALLDYDPILGLMPDDLTAKAVAYFETYLCSSINFFDELTRLGQIKVEQPVDSVRLAPWGTPNRPHLFEFPITITLSVPFWSKEEIYYTTDGSKPNICSQRYTKPFILDETKLIRVQAFREGKEVCIESVGFFVKLKPKPPLPDTYLGELKPIRAVGPGHSDSDASHRWSPFIKPPQVNKNNHGNPLLLQGKVYEKGIGVHATNQMLYKISPNYDRFVAQVGVDEEILKHDLGTNLAKYSSIVFRIFIDGKQLVESPVMRIGFIPWRFNVKIPEKAKIISLCTTDANDGNKADWADWVNAGFTLKKRAR
jgi:nicotinamidase-related amidase